MSLMHSEKIATQIASPQFSVQCVCVCSATSRFIFKNMATPLFILAHSCLHCMDKKRALVNRRTIISYGIYEFALLIELNDDRTKSI